MEEVYYKEIILKEKTKEECTVELLKSIIRTKQDLKDSHRNYEFAEGELIDYYLYQMKANQSKLNYLLKKAKNSGIMIDMVRDLEIRKEQFKQDQEAG